MRTAYTVRVGAPLPCRPSLPATAATAAADAASYNFLPYDGRM